MKKYLKCIYKTKSVVAKTVHEKARKEIQKIEETINGRMKHIYCMTRTKALFKQDVAENLCTTT